MRIHIDNGSKNRMIAISIVLMMVCLFLSRALLSVSMFIFLALTLIHVNIGQQLRNFIQSAFLVSITLLFFIPLISGAWSENAGEWSEVLRIKAPLLFFPVAFAGQWQFNQKTWVNLAFSFLLLMFIATTWSLVQYVSNMEGFHEAYLRSKTILTPMEDDHVRFSWLCAFAVVLSVLLIEIYQKRRTALYLGIIFFTIYLHILSARMGLFSLYIFFFLYAGWIIYKKRDKKLFLTVVSGILLLPVIAWLSFPTFRNRLQYFLYDISLVKSGTYVSGSNDGARIQSLKAGWELVKEHPAGVGAGDLKAEVFNWYALEVPGMRAGEKFLPCSELLIYGGYAGWAGMIALIIIMVIPFFTRNIKHRFFWIALHTLVAFSFAMDMTIEAQFGIFIYVCIVLWWWKWFQLKLSDES